MLSAFRHRLHAVWLLAIALLGALPAPSHDCTTPRARTFAAQAASAHAGHVSHDGTTPDQSVPATCDCIGAACCVAVAPGWPVCETAAWHATIVASAPRPFAAADLSRPAVPPHVLPFAIGPPTVPLL